MSAPYSVETVDLAVATTTPRNVVARGRQISSVTVMTLPKGATFKLHVGDGPGIPVVSQGLQMKAQQRRVNGVCSYPDAGLSVTIDSPVAGTASLLVTYGEEGLLEISGGGQVPDSGNPNICIGAVRTTGSVNGAPVCQLQNPVGSGRLLRVMAVYPSGGGDIIKVFESTPANLNGGGATIVTGVADWMDTRRNDAVTGVLKGSNFAVTYYAFNTQPSMFSIQTTTHNEMFGGREWYLSEGKALEVQWNTNGAGTIGITTYIWEVR